MRGRASRFRPFARLKAVDPGPRETEEERGEPPAPARPRREWSAGDVGPIRGERTGTREWNIWELEQLVRAGARDNPERSQEWAYLLVHLRQFATPDGALPPDFDGLVRESFGELLEASGRA